MQFACHAQTNINVIYSFVNGLGQTQTVKQISFTPLSFGIDGKAYVVGDETFRVITSSSYTNPMLSGFNYRVKYFSTIQPPTMTACFTNSFGTNVSGTVYAADYTSISTNLSNGLYAYSMAQSDALYAPIGSAGTATNLAGNALVQSTNIANGAAAALGTTSAVNMTNAANQFTGTFSGNGSGLTSITAGQVGAQPTNVNLTTLATLNGGSLTNLQAANLVGNISASQVTGLPTTNTLASTNGTYPQMTVGKATVASFLSGAVTNTTGLITNIPSGLVTNSGSATVTAPAYAMNNGTNFSVNANGNGIFGAVGITNQNITANNINAGNSAIQLNGSDGSATFANNNATINYDGSASFAGVSGNSTALYGVYGYSGGNVGVYGYSDGANGVYGYSSSSDAVYGQSDGGKGVSGYSSVAEGVFGTSYANNKYGVYGTSSGGHGVWSDGDLKVTTSASFANGVATIDGSGNLVVGPNVSIGTNGVIHALSYVGSYAAGSMSGQLVPNQISGTLTNNTTGKASGATNDASGVPITLNLTNVVQVNGTTNSVSVNIATRTATVMFNTNVITNNASPTLTGLSVGAQTALDVNGNGKLGGVGLTNGVITGNGSGITNVSASLPSATALLTITNLTVGAPIVYTGGTPTITINPNLTNLISSVVLDSNANNSRFNVTITTSSSAQAQSTNYFTINLSGTPPSTNALYVQMTPIGIGVSWVGGGQFKWAPITSSNSVTFWTSISAPVASTTYSYSIYLMR